MAEPDLQSAYLWTVSALVCVWFVVGVFSRYEHGFDIFAPEIAFALPESPQHELFVRLHHRSGVFGTFGGVHGGADVVTLGYRFRF